MQTSTRTQPALRWTKFVVLGLFLIAFNACKKDDSADPTPPDTGNDVISYSLPAGYPYPTVPPDNLPTANRIALGKKLFEDKILSQNNTISCSSCHRDDKSFIDGFQSSTGINNHVGTRNALSALNSAYLPSLLWDGKFPTLEAQALGPIENPIEMGSDINVVVNKIKNDPTYNNLFMTAYGEAPSIITLEKALACFERTLYSPASRYDNNALTPTEQSGKALFFGKANCSSCHSGFMFSNFNFENNGFFQTYSDSGRADVTLQASDLNKFRVPPLRNVNATAPYMHNGKVATLDAIVDRYNLGGYPHPNKSSVIQPLNLTTQEKADLVAFLKAI